MVILKGNLGQKNSTLFLGHNFNDFMEKEPCTAFCPVLTNSHEVVKLQSFEFSIEDIIPVNVRNIPSLVFFAYFC